MAAETNADLVELRRTLQTLKGEDAFSGSTRLAYAVDKSLREINNGLETYDEAIGEIAEEKGAEPTDNGVQFPDAETRVEFEQERQKLLEEEASADLHQIDEDTFFEYTDLNGSHKQVDLTVLDPLLKED